MHKHTRFSAHLQKEEEEDVQNFYPFVKVSGGGRRTLEKKKGGRDFHQIRRVRPLPPLPLEEIDVIANNAAFPLLPPPSSLKALSLFLL